MMKSQHKCFTRVFCPQLIRDVRSRRRFDSSSVIYEDHKLPSVATRDLEHAGHDSYLAL